MNQSQGEEYFNISFDGRGHLLIFLNGDHVRKGDDRQDLNNFWALILRKLPALLDLVFPAKSFLSPLSLSGYFKLA